MTKLKYGIIGWPVKHSRSPQMQMSAFQALNIDARYDLIPIKPECLATGIKELITKGYSGWNVTVPHKTNILPFLDETETTAKVCGSVNSVIVRDGKSFGYSTDGYGLQMSIKESFSIGIKGKTFLFWGSGGAATAVSAHFVNSGAEEIILVNRTLEKAQALKQKLQVVSTKTNVKIYHPSQISELASVTKTVDVIIQSTSVGLNTEDPISIPKELLIPSLNLVDMIYSETILLRAAKKLGCNAIDGKGMLLHQGAKSFEIWTEREAPVKVMRNALKS